VYPKLFQPVSIGKVMLKNRIALAPMGINRMTNPDGSLSQRAVDYYMETARGGVGLIIMGASKVENEVENIIIGRPALITPATQGSLSELCEAVHSLGVKVFIQLTAGLGRVVGLYRLRDKPVSASAIPHYWDPTTTCRELSTEEVERIVQAFGHAATLVAEAGVDGIELHGHEGYLFDQFTTAIWNKRVDKYGGELKDRLRFPIEVLQVIKNRVGADFPVQYRFGLKHYMKGLNSGALRGEEFVETGRDIQEGLEMAKLLEAAGFDSLHVDAGCYDSFYWAHPPMYQQAGCMVDMAAPVKEVVKVPVIAVGRLDIPELAEKVIAEEKADIVALGRGLLADPCWPVKVKRGAIEDIRPCIGCHNGCMRRLISCALNPARGRERLYELSRAERPRDILIAGGGIAGMEAARVAAMRGHKVMLYEKEEFLGGHLIAASVPSFKKDLKRLLDWYEGQLKKLDIVVKFQTEVSPALLEQGSPDVVIVATGSKPIIPDVPGVDEANVITCVDLLLGKKKAGSTIVVIGGGQVGCETALWLAEQGKRVTIVEALPELMTSGIQVPHMNRIMLLDLLALNRVSIITRGSVVGITDEGTIIVDEAMSRRVIKSDTIVLALGFSADWALYDALKDKVENLYAVGDCREARNILGAVWDAYEVSRIV
jgi:2-enoate reductase